MLRRLLGEMTEVQTELGPAMVSVDPGQVMQVILNLAVNARDAMPEGGRLTLRVSNVTLGEPDTDTLPPAKPGRYVVLTATDTGCGMDEQTRAHLFEPFFSGKSGGVGLGLATVYGIVVQSGGFIRVSSRQGQGSTFRVYLPGAAVGAEATDDGGGEESTQALGGRVTALLVEDEPAVHQTIRDLLEAFGLDVIEAGNGEEALNLFEDSADRIGLLLTDIVMAGMSGWELATRITASKSSIKVIYVSGYSRSEMREGHEMRPGDLFLQKPFSLDKLQHALESVLGSHEETAEAKVLTTVS